MQDRIKVLSEISLKSFCDKLNIDLKEYKDLIERKFIADYKYLFEASARDLKIENDENQLKNKKEELEKVKDFDYWDWVEYYSQSNKELFVGKLNFVLQEIPVNVNYLNRISSNYDCNVLDYIAQIPNIYLLELEFNAFLSGKSIIGDTPSIVYYNHLDFILSSFYDTIFSVYIIKSQTNANFELLSPEECVIISKSEEVQQRFHKFIKLLSFDTHLYKENAEYYDFEKGYIYFSKLHIESFDFIKFHEYGHLVLGHLDIGPSKEVEFEADLFAHESLYLLKKQDGFFNNYPEFTTAVIFFLLYMIEQIDFRDTDNDTHPDVLTRFIKGVNYFRSKSELNEERLVKNFNSLVFLFNPIFRNEFERILKVVSLDKEHMKELSTLYRKSI